MTRGVISPILDILWKVRVSELGGDRSVSRSLGKRHHAAGYFPVGPGGYTRERTGNLAEVFLRNDECLCLLCRQQRYSAY